MIGKITHKTIFQMAKNSGFISVNLGKFRLRTETAGIVACTIASLINNKPENI